MTLRDESNCAEIEPLLYTLVYYALRAVERESAILVYIENVEFTTTFSLLREENRVVLEDEMANATLKNIDAHFFLSHCANVYILFSGTHKKRFLLCVYVRKWFLKVGYSYLFIYVVMENVRYSACQFIIHNKVPQNSQNETWQNIIPIIYIIIIFGTHNGVARRVPFCRIIYYSHTHTRTYSQ